jgi:membrane-bound hydrogenase subunit beta
MATQEEKFRDDLAGRFPELADKIVIQRSRRIWVDVPLGRFGEVFDHCTGPLGVTILLILTGLDETETGTFGVIYHLSRPDGVVVNLKTHLPKDHPELKSITDRFPSAEAYERELVDLLGVRVTGLPEGPRYPLPDNWPEGEYPLRKDWKPAGNPPPAAEGGTRA